MTERLWLSALRRSRAFKKHLKSTHYKGTDMNQFNTTHHILDSFKESIHRTCTKSEIALLTSFALLPLCSIDGYALCKVNGYMLSSMEGYSFGSDAHDVYAVSNAGGDPIRLFSTNRAMPQLRVNPMQFTEVATGESVQVLGIHRDDSRESELYYFTL